MTLRLAVLISGRGTNLAAILQAIEAGSCDARVGLVVSDRADAAGLELARARGIDAAVVSMREQPDRAAWNAALAARVAQAAPDVIVLAGFMRVLGPAFLERFAHQIINVHPALLPLFPGTNGPEQAIAAGVRVAGCSVHMVDHGVDTGAIIAQAAVPVLPGDDANSLHTRIQRAEHELLPRVISAIARGEIQLGLQPRIKTHAAPDHTLFSLPAADAAPR
jgi:phosphoribosylglycinamide formyltransferase-1